MTLIVILLGYFLLLVVAGLFGWFLGAAKDPNYETIDLTKRGEHPQILLQFKVNKSAPSEIQASQETRESLPPTRPEGMRL